MESRARPFLTARWEHLVLLNYSVEHALLDPLVPKGTELDLWNGVPYVSLVGFRFLDTRVRGLAIPWHRDFDEVNLRFYVRRGDRRGVVFIREIVPRFAIAAIARWTYNEPYVTAPIEHEISKERVAYRWRYSGTSYELSASIEGEPLALAAESEAEFLTDRRWGYTRQRDGGTLEYEVEHPRWRIWHPTRAAIRGDASRLYGRSFGDVLGRSPDSTIVAEGSAVVVSPGRRIA